MNKITNTEKIERERWIKERRCFFIEEAIKKEEGTLADNGALVVRTGEFTGRAPQDRFIVKDELTEKNVWWNNINIPVSPQTFENLKRKLLNHLNNKNPYILYCRAGAYEKYSIRIKLILEYAWHALFAHNIFIPEQDEQYDWEIIVSPSFRANGKSDGVRQHNFVIINMSQKCIIIGGTAYAGEIKKSVFTVMNFIIPFYYKAISMHCAANIGVNGDVALFFGLSGTGKTSLSTTSDRFIIGDDEHIWCDDGIFNIEGGCYAKCINLNPLKEKEIYSAIKFGSVVENTVFYPNSRTIDYSNASITENTRANYPLEFIPNHYPEKIAPHPKHIFFLSCDANGILPPVALLDKQQAIFYFLTGYTSKVAGTEVGIKEPQVTFSYCFGAPFMPLHPFTYAKLLLEKIQKYNTKVWLINTGWIYGPYGVGKRIDINYSRKIINAILSNQLDSASFIQDSDFQFLIPQSINELPSDILLPEKSWKNKNEYIHAKKQLLNRFKKFFEDTYYTDNINSLFYEAETSFIEK